MPAQVVTVSKKQTQAARILELLSSKSEVSALELSTVSLQYCARVAELRKTGAIISNRVEVLSDGRRHGFYRLVQRPPFAQTPSSRSVCEKPSNVPASGSLFPLIDTYQYPD
jgi:hypothetical protein